MRLTTGLLKMARNTVIAMLAIGATALALPDTAAAGVGPKQVAERLDQISYEIDRISEARGLHRKGKRIDHLQSRLHKLDRINDRHRGRLARRNDAVIDRLQHRLHRLERRAEARIDNRRDRRRDSYQDWRRDWRNDGRRYDRSGWTYRGPGVVYGTFGH